MMLYQNSILYKCLKRQDKEVITKNYFNNTKNFKKNSFI